MAEKRHLHVTWELRTGAGVQRVDVGQLGSDVKALRADMIAPNEVRVSVATPAGAALSPIDRSNAGC
jgi:hypothetical protein